MYLGVDIGGTRIKTITIDRGGRILNENEYSTHDPKSKVTDWKSKVIDIIDRTTHELAQGNSNDLICGISAPGLTNSENSLIWHMPNRLLGIENFDWGAELNREIWVLNDGHSATFAEYNSYYSDKVQNMILLTLGTGVGGGIILDGKLFTGHLGRAGHFGHISLDSGGPLTMTNLPGSIEYLMGDFSVNERTHGVFDSTYELVEAYKNNEPLASYWWLSSIKKIAIALASLNNAFSPEVIVIGGGIACAGQDFFDPLKQFLDLYEWRPKNEKIKILRARYGNFAGAVGAALFAKESHEQKVLK